MYILFVHDLLNNNNNITVIVVPQTDMIMVKLEYDLILKLWNLIV